MINRWSSQLKQWGVNVNYALIVPDERFDFYNTKYGSKSAHGVLVFTTSNCLGLEFERVALIEPLNNPLVAAINKKIPFTGLEIKTNQPKSSQEGLSTEQQTFLNRLYVASGRAIDSLYIIQEDEHRCGNLLNQLLEKTQPQNKITLEEIKASSEEERINMANKLEINGFKAQAQAIRSKLKPPSPKATTRG